MVKTETGTPPLSLPMDESRGISRDVLMLVVGDIAAVDRLVIKPLEQGRRISMAGFLELLELVREVAPGRGWDVTFFQKRARGRGVSRNVELEHLVPAPVLEKVGGEGAHLLGHALSGRMSAAWAFRKLVAPGTWDVCEADPVKDRSYVCMHIYGPGDQEDTFAMCSPLMAHSALAYVWAGVRELQVTIEAEREHARTTERHHLVELSPQGRNARRTRLR